MPRTFQIDSLCLSKIVIFSKRDTRREDPVGPGHLWQAPLFGPGIMFIVLLFDICILSHSK